MQGRHAEAAAEYGTAARLLGAALGADSEAAVAAAAARVRALRAAGQTEEADK
jgi:hypothetical protein